MTAADVLDVIARLIGCAGQATDAVSAYIHIKMEDVPTMLERLKVQVIGYVSHGQNGQRLGRISKNQWFLW